jgi:hypothetical protein
LQAVVQAMKEWNPALAGEFSEGERVLLESYLQRMAARAEGACDRQKTHP